MNTVEKIACAISGAPFPSQKSMAKAKAVLTALSEPDRSMIEAGFLAPHPAYEPADPRDVWQAMLAAALGDG